MTTVRSLLEAADLRPVEAVCWGSEPTVAGPGVYLVSTSADPDAEKGRAVFSGDVAAVRTLLAERPEARVDGIPATEASVIERLGVMWVSHEPVVYIGLAGTSVATRVSQYYRTRIGARAPHAGGWPIKMLKDLDQLWVHCAACDDPGTAETTMLRAFASGCDAATKAGLYDSEVVLPFANLELTKGLRKRHGFTGVKEPRSKSVATAARPSQEEPTAAPRPLVTGPTWQTQNVTATDIANGRIRVPSRTKRLFPAAKSQIEIELCGTRLTARWDPGYGPDKERSGVIAVGKAGLAPLVRPGRALRVTSHDGVVRVG